KAGGVKSAASPAAVAQAARDIFALHISGYPVERVLVAEALQIKQEYYFGLTIDRNARGVRCILSAAGGIDIELTAQEAPQKIVSVLLPPYFPGQKYEVPSELLRVFEAQESAAAAAEALAALIRLFNENDCSLVEVNPYILTIDNKLIAADAKIVLDDNALFKHPDLEALQNREEYSEDERAARRANLSFVGLTGDIGCMVNGAGLAMATMDLIELFGGRPANFLDVGGSSNSQKVVAAFKILLANKTIKVVLVNIFGGITRCDDIAAGIILAKQELGITLPLVVRLTGTNEEQGRKMLSEAGLAAEAAMAAAVRQAVAIAGSAA
ncbi:MAG: succinate--CoA ligase subunit beta, partial [Chitinivibrionales bacterium]|nr:succinate--CoA ligase subunit beta [Chitinivibrionales bacterium]